MNASELAQAQERSNKAQKRSEKREQMIHELTLITERIFDVSFDTDCGAMTIAEIRNRGNESDINLTGYFFQLKTAGFIGDETIFEAFTVNELHTNLKEALAELQQIETGVHVIKEKVEKAVEGEKLSPENREFLDEKIKPQLVEFIRNLPDIGLECKTNVDDLMAILENLGDPTLDVVRTEFKQPEITLDLGEKLEKLKLLINEHFNPEYNDMIMDAVDGVNLNDKVWLEGDKKVGVFILEGLDKIPVDPNITEKKGNWGGERDAYIAELEAEQEKGLKVDDLSATQYLLWAASNKLGKKERSIDSETTWTLLKSKKGSPRVPIGCTRAVDVCLFQGDVINRNDKLRRRRAVGGYVQ